MSLHIKNGRIITAVDDYRADLYIDQEKVTLIGLDLDVTADRVLDATNRYVIPGGIDPHTHLDMPFGGTVSADNFETGTRAAAHGGTTTLIDFAIQTKGRSVLEALETWHRKAAGQTAIDYGFHMIITDMQADGLPEMRIMADEGVTSYKLFMAYPGLLYVDDGTLYRVMRKAGENGTVICMHAENGIVIDEIVKSALAEGKTEPKWHALTRPTRMEAEGVHRSIAIAEVAGVPVYIVHLSSADALEQVVLARDRGVAVFAETCPQYLFLDHSYYEQEGFEGAKYVMTPPLREKWNQEELWRGLRFGDLQSISTDHCPFCYKDQKELGVDDFSKIPNGGPGVENRMSLVHSGGVLPGRISLNKFVELTSTAAAKMFGLFPRKGTIAVGSDADLVLFNPGRKETISVGNPVTHNMNVDYSAYEGFKITGVSETVISRGKVVIEDCKYVGSKGDGQFLKRGTYSGIR
ncbi:MAG: dihydropyrimidinase [Candidatus Marinimicrobia bacterium]|nr:dihydropyrimidinase [Candidatus Neomarinimicrobiota bacterium]